MEGVSFQNHYMLLRHGFIEDILSSEICTPNSSIARLDRNDDVAYVHSFDSSQNDIHNSQKIV